jgi:hypothetical protein
MRYEMIHHKSIGCKCTERESLETALVEVIRESTSADRKTRLLGDVDRGPTGFGLPREFVGRILG